MDRKHLWLAAAALIPLFGLHAAGNAVRERADAAALELRRLDAAADGLGDTLENAKTLRDLKARDLDSFKKGLAQLTVSRRELYEAGLQLQEEKRQLEKLKDVLMTYLLVNKALRKVGVMRGDQALLTYDIGYPPKGFSLPDGPLPRLVRIVSKERFAHPQRGAYELAAGQVKWEPPQVGPSSRTAALGEFVVFTDSALILHGPPTSKKEHERYPHVCVGLSLPVAKRLYEKSFIGTKLLTE